MRSVTIYTTSKCNLRCKHCGVGLDQDDPRDQQSTEELMEIVTKLAEGGAKCITILGGEATIYRRDLAQILDHANEVGIKVSINTNLTSYKAIESLIDKPALDAFIVSLDGACIETHDAMRGKGTFKKTSENLKRLTSHPRVQNKKLGVELAFVMSALNYKDARKMIQVAIEMGATRLNVKNVKLFGRASDFSNELTMSYKDLLEAYCALVVNWMVSKKKIEFEIFIPPSFAVFLNRRFGLNFSTEPFAACGGESNYSYVDLYGNHVPCPAMSYEEHPENGLNQRDYQLNLIEHSVQETFNTDVFKLFEENRTRRVYKDKLYPCRYCKFNTECQQCVAGIVAGADEEIVDICSSVFQYGEDQVPGIREEIWGNAMPREI